MALPEQIRKQTEAVQELYKQLNTDDNTGAGATPPADGTVPPVENAGNQNPADENSVPNNAAPAPAGEQKPGADNVPEETITQKYKTLQGMYNAEVPRLHQQNREMQQRVQQMEQLLASMTAVQPSAAPVTAEKLVTDQDVADYGESLDVMRKVTREELGAVAQRIAAIEATLRQMQTQVVPQVQAVAHRIVHGGALYRESVVVTPEVVLLAETFYKQGDVVDFGGSKYVATEACFSIVDQTVQIHGGAGFMRESEIERLYRDCRILRIFEGTSQIQRLVIAKEIYLPDGA